MLDSEQLSIVFSQFGSGLLKRNQGPISQSTKIHLKMSCQYIASITLYCSITLCLAIKIDWQLRSILALSEIKPRSSTNAELQPLRFYGFFIRIEAL